MLWQKPKVQLGHKGGSRWLHWRDWDERKSTIGATQKRSKTKTNSWGRMLCKEGEVKPKIEDVRKIAILGTRNNLVWLGLGL